MDSTDWFLFLMAGLLTVGVGAFIWQARRRAAETELIRAALYAVAASNPYFRTYNPVPVTFDVSVNKAISHFAKTATDVQGMIELMARYIVSQMPAADLEGMKVPEDWTTADKITRQGIVKRGD